jgi:MFS family permease
VDGRSHQPHESTLAAADSGPLGSPPANPICVAVRPSNLRPILAASLVPMLWSGSFYLTFVWMAVYMSSLSDAPVPYAFGINTVCMFLSLCLFFPMAGIASDRLGRRAVMTFGGVSCAVLGPVAIRLISSGNAGSALAGQLSLGVAVSCYGAPMCAWLVEAFRDPDARLTSANIGYNIAQALAGGSAPALATLVADRWGSSAPGYLYSVLAALALVGLWLVADDPAQPLSSRDAPSTELQEPTSSSPRHSTPSLRGRVRGDFTSIPSTEDESNG